ncbi:Malate dehydrogenase, cytoplasmic [Oopsacas minuta]|uniref:Malate dehydrogenase, cytoplasmic n=1 Tax=Oopsacas minuta TaxID=111878 RepID=A0AAV7KJL7_9METZ|nr:Malate dehydrogenase, cytoplasmic [Oopsacas minuta]
MASLEKSTLKVCITGAGGQISYSLLYMICDGKMFGKDQPVTLTLLEIPVVLDVVKGVILELEDCGLHLLKSAIATADPREAFDKVDVVLMVGAFPRKEGMERAELLQRNAGIFKDHGAIINDIAKKEVKVLVVGNPANTNCLIASTLAPSIAKKNFSCLTRLDHNRAVAQTAAKLGIPTCDVKKITIWGNHSNTQFPDLAHGEVNVGGVKKPALIALSDDAWANGEFITTVQTRGAAIIKARKLSSAMSAAQAICDHMRDWYFGTMDDNWVSMGVCSDGNPYGIPDGLIFSFPVRIKNGTWEFVPGLTFSDFARGKLDVTVKELMEEKSVAFEFLGVK